MMERLDTLEETVRGIQGHSMEDVRQELMAELISMRTQIGNMTASVPAGAQTRDGRSLYNSKEFTGAELSLVTDHNFGAVEESRVKDTDSIWWC